MYPFPLNGLLPNATSRKHTYNFWPPKIRLLYKQKCEKYQSFYLIFFFIFGGEIFYMFEKGVFVLKNEAEVSIGQKWVNKNS